MSVKWKTKNAAPPRALIKEAASVIRATGDKGTSLTIGHSDFVCDALLGTIEHPYDLAAEVLHRHLLHVIAQAPRNQNTIDPEIITKEFKRRCEEHLRKHFQYVLVTTVSLNKDQNLKRRHVDSCRVEFHRVVPKKYQTSRTKVIAQHYTHELVEKEQFLCACVHVNAPDERTAFNRAMRALDLLRSLWQLAHRRPINFLASAAHLEFPSDALMGLGPLHTLHRPTGAALPTTLWFERPYQPMPPTGVPDLAATEASLTQLLSLLRRNPYVDHMTVALRSYISAVDQHQQQFRFLKLWVTLEALLKTDQAKLLIRRASFFYENREYQRALLWSLRDARNFTAHKSGEAEGMEMKNFQFAEIIRHILMVFLRNPFREERVDKILEMLSISDEQSIDEQIMRLRKIKRLLNG